MSRMSDEVFEVVFAGRADSPDVTIRFANLLFEARRARESEATKLNLLSRLRHRLEHAACAGVESWPEYIELKELVAP